MSSEASLRRLVALPVWRALLALLAGILLTVLLRLAPMPLPRSLGAAALLAGVLAALAGWLLRLGLGWRGFLLFLPTALAWQLGQALPSWVYGGLLLVCLLVFGGGLVTRAPLYNSNRAAWRTLESLLPEVPGTFIDLGAGLGGPLAHLSRCRPEWRFRGVEASPLVWLAAWLRCRRPNCRVRFGSLWNEPLGDCDVAYAFLSPAPMAEVWRRVRSVMRPGSLFISHTFEVPGLDHERIIPLPGRRGACLRVYRIP